MKFRRVQVLKVQTGTVYKLGTDRYRIQILGVHSRRQIAIVILIGRFLAINRYRRYHRVYAVPPRVVPQYNLDKWTLLRLYLDKWTLLRL